jgi:hypothetical protein
MAGLRRAGGGNPGLTVDLAGDGHPVAGIILDHWLATAAW